jgi:hypothetical protein
MSSRSDTDPITVVAGHERLTSMFGRWPSFHDAEVVDLHLWRGEVKPGDWDDSNVFPVLTVKLRILEATQIGATDAGHDVLATLRFHDVDDLKLEGFNHVNQIVELSLSIQPRGAFTDGSPLPPYIVVEFKNGFGIAASFKCFRIEVLDAARYPPYMSAALSDVEAVLESLTEPQLVQFLVRYAYQLTMLARGTYIPGGDDLEDPKLMRLVNETVHRALDHADACLSGRTPRRPIPALHGVLFAHDSEAMRRMAKFAFENAHKNLGISGK